MAVQITVEGQAPKYLTAPAYTLGRAVECDVRLPENDRLVSRHHARLEREGEQWWIVDLSTNGTFVNGARITARQALREGDQIGIGRTQIAFDVLADPAPPAVAQESPARSAQTVFVTANDLRASAREASARSQAALATPLAPTSPSAVPPVAGASDSGAAALAAKASRPSESATSARASLENLEARAARSGAQVPWTNGNAGPRQNQAELEPIEASAGMADGLERQKQCSNCGHMYALEQNDCPSCGSSSFKINGAAKATVMVTDRMMERVTSPGNSAKASASVSASGATPFDLLAKRGKAASPPKDSNGAASGEALDVDTAPSIPVVASEERNIPGKLPEGVTFGLPAEPKAGPSLRRIGVACGLTMLISLFLPWVLSVVDTVSYARLCITALQGAGQPEHGGLLLLLPALATLATLGAALAISASGRTTARGSLVALACGGALGMLGFWMLQDNDSGLTGPGLWIFAAASVGAVLVALSRLAALVQR